VVTALSAAATRAEAALRAAATNGIADVDRRTTGMGIGTRWDHARGVVDGYTAHQALRLTVRDRDQAGAVLGALADAAGDALGVDQVSLEVSDPAPLLERAREVAFAEARGKAEQYAALSGRALGPVLRVRETPGADGPGPSPLRVMAAESGASMPLEPGESTVTTSVVVRFGLV
ncbi:MAG: SIMPL domain-containing protein, partial [Ornithinibacter sp.]